MTQRDNTLNYVQRRVEDLTNLLPGLPSELIDLYACLAHTKGTDTTLKDVHDAWSIWQNRIDPNHKSLLPFEELSPEIQELDRKYMVAIHMVAGTTYIN